MNVQTITTNPLPKLFPKESGKIFAKSMTPALLLMMSLILSSYIDELSLLYLLGPYVLLLTGISYTLFKQSDRYQIDFQIFITIVILIPFMVGLLLVVFYLWEFASITLIIILFIIDIIIWIVPGLLVSRSVYALDEINTKYHGDESNKLKSILEINFICGGIFVPLILSITTIYFWKTFSINNEYLRISASICISGICLLILICMWIIVFKCISITSKLAKDLFGVAIFAGFSLTWFIMTPNLFNTRFPETKIMRSIMLVSIVVVVFQMIRYYRQPQFSVYSSTMKKARE